jgi:capping protein (actin filament) muscle Z-line, alpha
VDVHYYEDGNVRLLTNKDVTASGGSSAAEVIKAVAIAERKYQEELNRGFTGLSEGAFKGLRRNLPVSRSKMAWERWEGLRIG